jgi:hypothetical protein
MSLDTFLIQKILLWQKPVSSMAKPLGSELLLSRQVFSAQDGARKNKKYVQNRLEKNILNMFLKILYIVARMATENVWQLHFVEPGGRGGGGTEGHTWVSKFLRITTP